MAFDSARLTRDLAMIVAGRPLPDGGAYWSEVCAACAAAVGMDGAGLSLMSPSPEGGRMLLGASDAAGLQIEELQLTVGEGPCRSAYAAARPVLVNDLASPEAQARWPM